MYRIGHRGAKGYEAENTMASFEKAIALGVDMIELDVHLSSDKVPVVIHDSTVNRTTAKTGWVADYESNELRALGIPALRDVVNCVKQRCGLNIELKTFEATQAVVELLDSTQLHKSDVIISSFDWNALQAVRLYNKTIRIGVLTETDLPLAMAFAQWMQAYSIHPYFHLLDETNCASMRAAGFKVFTWTVNEPEDITFVRKMGVDGIISDFPDRI